MKREQIIKLIKNAWEAGLGSYHDCKRSLQYDKELKEYIESIADELLALEECHVNVSKDVTKEPAKDSYHIPDVGKTIADMKCDACGEYIEAQGTIKYLCKNPYCENYIKIKS